MNEEMGVPKSSSWGKDAIAGWIGQGGPENDQKS
jgi:hypothetical protein